ncbi:Death-associated protein kinase 1 like protein [Argiope bruennichi]|uniref:Death-associated protein kinase 1 like protein n=1 Tax=Argiope bruennichi TaxID=94029 RepID=A0A8T0FKI1_ARGBR|nr:Death-associated protein kinase 1 like protein [Argiope bruennichi]
MMNRNDLNFTKAVSKKKFEDIEELFPLASTGVKRHYITRDVFHPLHYASSPEIVRCFISSGVDVNIKNFETDETPLLTVIKLNESPDVVKELIKCGASIEARNKHTLNTPLNQAMLVPECSLRTIQVLLECGAAVHTANKHCDTPLHNACRRFQGDLKIIELLLQSGSPVNFRNLRGDTPLNLSLQNPLCTVELVRKLLQFNAKVTLKTFQHAVQMQHDDYLNIISELIQSTCITNEEYWTNILEHILKWVRNDQNLIECGRLLIKYSFLQCDIPHASFVHIIERLKSNSVYNYPIIRSIRATGFVPRHIRELGSSLASAFDNLKSFCDDCFAEIERMKTDMFENNVSVFEFIRSKTSKFPLDSKILKLLKENIYPIYADTILNKIKRAAILNKLIAQQVYTIVQQGDVTRRITLDVFSVCNIAKYLNVYEIQKFADAFCNPLEHETYFWDTLVEIENSFAKKHRKRRSVIKKKISPIIAHSSSKVQKKTSPRI